MKSDQGSVAGPGAPGIPGWAVHWVNPASSCGGIVRQWFVALPGFPGGPSWFDGSPAWAAPPISIAAAAAATASAASRGTCRIM
jgi:hypothetical protein